MNEVYGTHQSDHVSAEALHAHIRAAESPFDGHFRRDDLGHIELDDPTDLLNGGRHSDTSADAIPRSVIILVLS